MLFKLVCVSEHVCVWAHAADTLNVIFLHTPFNLTSWCSDALLILITLVFSVTSTHGCKDVLAWCKPLLENWQQKIKFSHQGLIFPPDSLVYFFQTHLKFLLVCLTLTAPYYVLLCHSPGHSLPFCWLLTTVPLQCPALWMSRAISGCVLFFL